ncbi:MAG: hypothetical protein QW692_05280 [Nitrososphaerota archaeon]
MTYIVKMREKGRLDTWGSFRLSRRDYELLRREAMRRHMKPTALIRAIVVEWLKENAGKEAIGI